MCVTSNNFYMLSKYFYSNHKAMNSKKKDHKNCKRYKKGGNPSSRCETIIAHGKLETRIELFFFEI